jgi:hypothetical protein
MHTISKLAVVAFLMLGAASAAQAANDNQSDPTRGSTTGPEGQREGGRAVNPADHRRHAAHHSKTVAKKEKPNPDADTH